MNNQNVEAAIRKASSRIIPQQKDRMLMSEVRIYDGKGRLKNTIPPKELMAKLYKSDGLSTAPFPSNQPAKKTKHGKGTCLQCKKEFDKTYFSQKFCKQESGQEHIRNYCYRKYTAERLKVPKSKRICRSCKKEFLGSKSRVYCNDPCYDPSRKKEFLAYDPKPCKLCEKEYVPRDSRQVFCQDPCSYQMHRDKLRQDKRNALEKEQEVLKSDNDSKQTTTQSGEVQITNSI